MLPKTSIYVKSYDGQTKWMYVLIKVDRYNTIWNKVIADMKENLTASLSIIKIIWKQKKNLMAINFKIFTIKKLDSNHTCSAVVSLDSALKKEIVIVQKCFKKSVNILWKK